MGKRVDDPGQGRNDDKRREHHAQGGRDAADDAPALLADKRGGVHGDDAGGTLADGKVIGQLLIGGPALVLHHLPLQDRQHGIAAAEGHDPHLGEGQKQRKQLLQQTHLPR